MIHLRAVLVICAALFVSACLPVTSTSPVGSTAGLKADPALIGIWKGKPKDADNSSYFAFQQGEEGTINALLFSLDPNDSGWMVLSLQTAELGGTHFMNAKIVAQSGDNSDDPLSKKTIPLMYSFSRGKLTLYLINEDAAKAAVTAGKIQGTVEPGSYGDVVLTASPEQLDKFMQSADGKALFKDEFATLTKIQ